MSGAEHRTEEDVLAEQSADAVDDLELQDEQATEARGGDLPTEQVSLNFKK